MSEIKKSEVFYFLIGEFEFRFTKKKDQLHILNKDVLRRVHGDITIPIEILKEAIKKMEEFKIAD